jgi:hypothetical protein
MDSSSLFNYIRYLIIFSRSLSCKDEEASLEEREESMLMFFYPTLSSSSLPSSSSNKEKQLALMSTLEAVIDIMQVCILFILDLGLLIIISHKIDLHKRRRR